MSAERRRAGASKVAGKVFTTKEIARLAKLSAKRVRRCVHAGFLEPRRGSRRRFEYSMRDLLVLRTTRALLDARVGPSRIAEVMRSLRGKLPADRDVTSLRVSLDDTGIVVADGGRRWRLETGQLLLGLERPRRSAPVQTISSDDDDRGAYRAFTRGLALEELATDEAKHSYREALRLDPTAVPALVNLGRLEHEAGDLEAAETHYRAALSIDCEERTAAFNLAVLAEDRGQPRLAVQRYHELLGIDPEHAEAHHRLALLYGRLRDRNAARRHQLRHRTILRRRK